MGTPIFSDHEIEVLKVGEAYVADPFDLQPGTYVVTDFMIVKESEVLNAAPKGESPFSAFVRQSLPYRFSVTESGVTKVSMQVLDARNEKPESFGYTSFKLKKKANQLSFILSKGAAQTSLKEAHAELRQGKHLIKKFSVKPGLNSIAFEDEPDAMYTLSVFAGETAKTQTFNFKALNEQLGGRPLKMTLEPALLLTVESFVEEGNPYEDYFEFLLDGTQGSVNVNWGDGHKRSYSLPLTDTHEYTMGTYTAIITGDLDEITNLHGFSYNTIINAISGLTNLTELKAYNPSWGAVPIKVNLSNCKQLETIWVEKYGAPFEPIDLRTDFLLPEEHFIRTFVLLVPSLDPTRENISTAELEVLVDNIYNNTTQRNIYGGRFYVYPVDDPSPETQQKLNILQNDYDWDVGLDGIIWDDASAAGRTKQKLDTRLENWLRDKFPKSKTLTLRGRKLAY